MGLKLVVPRLSICGGFLSLLPMGFSVIFSVLQEFVYVRLQVPIRIFHCAKLVMGLNQLLLQ